MDELLDPLNSLTALEYLDDYTIFLETLEEDIFLVKQLFTLPQKAGVASNLE